MYSRLIPLLISLLFVGNACAQESSGDASCSMFAKGGYGIETNFLAAKVFKHTPKFTAPIPPLTTAVDVNFVFQTYGSRPWHRQRNFPLIGIGLTYTDYGNNAVFGNCLGVYANLQVPIIRRDNFEWTFRIGDGLGYVTRKYQRTAPEDTVNTAISTHINDFAIFMMDFRHHINAHWHIQYGLNFTHISNGGFYLPNLGINTVGGHVGLIYFPVKCHPKRIVAEDAPAQKSQWLFEARMDFSFNRARAQGNPVLPAYMPSAFVSKRWLNKNKFFGGVDYGFYNDVLAFMRYYDVDHGHQKQESWDGYVFVGNEFMMGNRLGLVTSLGVNYHQTFLKYDGYCEKIGFNFYLYKAQHGPVKEVFASLLLVAHGTVAERAEYGIGIGI